MESCCFSSTWCSFGGETWVHVTRLTSVGSNLEPGSSSKDYRFELHWCSESWATFRLLSVEGVLYMPGFLWKSAVFENKLHCGVGRGNVTSSPVQPNTLLVGDMGVNTERVWHMYRLNMEPRSHLRITGASWSKFHWCSESCPSLRLFVWESFICALIVEGDNAWILVMKHILHSHIDILNQALA